MLKMMGRSAVVAAGVLLATGVAAASDRDASSPESRIYLGLSFGGERAAPRALHYGLRIDRDSRFGDAPSVPLMLIDFTVRGLADARVSGVSVLRREYRLRQTEEGAPAEAPPEAPAEAPAEAAAEAPAEAPAEAAAPAAEEVAAGDAGADADAGGEEVATDGVFLNYGIVDWVLLAAGLGGVGMAVAEVANSDEDASRRDSDGDGIPDNEEPGGGNKCPVPGVPLPPGCTPFMETGLAGGAGAIEHKEWLDEGTGHMGDLVEVRR